MAKFGSLKFGCVTIDGKKYRHDVVVFPNGEVKKRKGGLGIFGSHLFRKEEIEELSNAETIVIGDGTISKAKIAEDAEKFAEENGMKIIQLPSKEAIKKFNELADKGKVGAIIHVTC
ncbi:MAG: MTH938/NDUFAF3 family protein [Candidatus Thermoplasmatota archaeon]|nr:MTH938/NDUFAF3 family protein [Candidatus Thermoplasmatota archaeon]